MAGQKYPRRRNEANVSFEPRDRAGLAIENLTALLPVFYPFRGKHSAHDYEALERRFVGGPQSLSAKLAESQGDDLVLASPVVKIKSAGLAGVEVVSTRVVVAAQRVVVAMMPADTRRIEFIPELPRERRGLVDGWRGQIIDQGQCCL